MITGSEFKSTFAGRLVRTGSLARCHFIGCDPELRPPRVLSITRRLRRDATRVASCSDFDLRESDTDEDLSTAVAERSNVTPYCLDHKNRRMIFAEVPPEIDLSAASFYYQRQFETALRLFALPYERVHEVAARLPARFDDLVIIYSVGRCGSTLLSKMWWRLDDTYSLSEPDVVTQLCQLRSEGLLPEGEALQLLDDAVRLLYRPLTPRRRFVLKLRAHCIELGELMHLLFPDAKVLFMYRNAVDCIDSHVRAFGVVPIPEEALRQAFPLAEAAPQVYERLAWVGWPMLNWLGGVRHYLELRESGLPVVALKYEELIRDPLSSIARLFAHCGVAEALVPQACAAMTADALADSRLARNIDGRPVLTADESRCIRAFFAEHVGFAPDATLAGTLND